MLAAVTSRTRTWSAVVTALAHALSQPVPANGDERVDFFETRIRPVLVRHCYECHSAAAAEVKGQLLVDFRDGLLKGGESGKVIVPGKPDESLILEAMRHESFEMPPERKLPNHVIADFEKWIRDGAFDPRDKQPTATEAADAAWQIQFAERSRWWSLQSPKESAPPTVEDSAWARDPVDRFVKATLDAAKLAPAESADALVLLRRLSFVLTGLPPEPERVHSFPVAFLNDPESALAELVDELLDSPHFGERFARHWMDVVRYTDTYGYEWDTPAKGSWEYRDYLIRAFNDDIPFDRMIREQVAGDLLSDQRINKAAGVNESMIGPMFYHMGEHRHGNSFNFNGIHQEMINNKIDAFSKAFLAMTVACARCHDHKLDAISQADYYALAGVFMSPRWTSRVIDAPGKHDRQIAELKSLRSEIRDALAEHWQSTDLDLANKLKAWAMKGRAGVLKVAIDDPAYPMRKVLESTDDTIAGAWKEAIAEWRNTRDDRIRSNAEKFTVLADFERPEFPNGWVTEGDGIKHGYAQGGEPLVSLDGYTIIDRLLPRGFHTNALSSKLPGSVRPPRSLRR